MADMTATTMANWIPKVYSAKASVTYRARTMFVPLLDHTWEPELGVGRGDTVNIPFFSQNNSPRNRGAGTGTFGTGAAITFDATTEDKAQLVVDRFYYKAFRQPVESQAQLMSNYTIMLIEGQGDAIRLQIDADIAADNTNGFDAFTTAVGADNVDLTEDVLLTVQTSLNGQNTRKKRNLAVSPAGHSSLMKIEAFRNQLYAGAMGNLDGAKGQGYVGQVLSFDTYMSNNLEAGTAGKKGAAWDTEAIAFAEQLSLKTLNDMNLEDGVFEQWVTFNTCGFKIVKNAFGNEVDMK